MFHYVWPVQASGAMWTSLGSALRAMARLAVAGSRGDERAVLGDAAETLRLQASHDFQIAQQLADQAAFELGDPSRESLATRERLQRAAADAQSVFLTQLAIVHEPRDVVPPLPEALDDAIRRFDEAVSESLEAIADRAERGAQRPMPDLGARLALVTALVAEKVPGFVAGRLALYRDLVLRIDRLAADFAA